MPRKAALALALTLSVTLTEGAGLLLLVPLLGLVGLDVQRGQVGRVSELVAAVFASVGVRPTLPVILGVYLAIVCARAILYRWQITTTTALHRQFGSRLRQGLYRSIASTNWPFFSRSRASDFTHALTAEIDRVALATQCLLSILVDAIVGSVYLLLALQLSPLITGLVAVCGAGLWLALRRKTHAARIRGEAISVEATRLYAAVTEHLGSMKIARSYGAQGRSVETFSRLADRLAHVYTDLSRGNAEVRAWFDIGSVLVLCLTLLILVEFLAMPTGGIVLLLFVYFRLIPRFTNIQYAYQDFISLLPAFGTVMAMRARCEAAAEPAPARTGMIELRRSLGFEAVSFAYEEGRPFAIAELDLVIRAGRTTAIVGPSGAGKSTIADLAMGLIVPARGRVLVDGAPLTSDVMGSWREQIGYVPQDTFLFHDTIRANLLWACPGAGDEEVWDALRWAAAEGFVLALPKQLDTVVGDRGLRLSGGERQRLALARALLRKPALLILDEATSNLDSENERRIQTAIESLHRQMTILVITHRLASVRGADIIYVLEQGRLVESGGWDRLISDEHSRLSALWRGRVDAPGHDRLSYSTPVRAESGVES